jgi:hypothetical protein
MPLSPVGIRLSRIVDELRCLEGLELDRVAASFFGDSDHFESTVQFAIVIDPHLRNNKWSTANANISIANLDF